MSGVQKRLGGLQVDGLIGCGALGAAAWSAKAETPTYAGALAVGHLLFPCKQEWTLPRCAPTAELADWGAPSLGFELDFSATADAPPQRAAVPVTELALGGWDRHPAPVRATGPLDLYEPAKVSLPGIGAFPDVGDVFRTSLGSHSLFGNCADLDARAPEYGDAQKFEGLVAAILAETAVVDGLLETASGTAQISTRAAARAATLEGKVSAQDPEGSRWKLFSKTRMCRFDQAGRCRKGQQCPFAHGVEEVRAFPDLTKTSICARWARRCCPYPSRECRFAHGARDLRGGMALGAMNQAKVAVTL